MHAGQVPGGKSPALPTTAWPDHGATRPDMNYWHDGPRRDDHRWRYGFDHRHSYGCRLHGRNDQRTNPSFLHQDHFRRSRSSQDSVGVDVIDDNLVRDAGVGHRENFLRRDCLSANGVNDGMILRFYPVHLVAHYRPRHGTETGPKCGPRCHISVRSAAGQRSNSTPQDASQQSPLARVSGRLAAGK